MNRIGEFLASHRYSEATKDSYCRIFHRVLEGQDLTSLTAAELVGLIKGQGWGNSQQCVAVAACRKFLRWCYGAGHPALSARVKPIPPPPQPRLSKEQVIKLLESFDDDDKGRRDRAIVTVALDTGLRATELCNLQIGNVYLQERKLFALVKGGQWSWRAISQRTACRVSEWMQVRCPAIGVQTLFVGFQSQSRGQPLTREGLQTIMLYWGRKVGFHVHPHMFRRSLASLGTLAGGPRAIIKRGGGWQSDVVFDHYVGDLTLDAIRPYLPVDNLSK